MSFSKFTEIKSEGVVKKCFKAKIIDFEEKVAATTLKPYLCLTLGQGKSKITALAFDPNVESVKTLYKARLNQEVEFPTGTFKGKKRDKKYPSSSTSQFDLVFENEKPTSTVEPRPSGSKSYVKTKTTKVDGQGTSSVKGIKDALLRIGKRGAFSMELNNVRFSGGKLHRYAGCEQCNKKITKPYSDGKFRCRGTCSKKKGGEGVLTKRCLFIMVRKVKILDDKNESIEDVVIFPKQCQELLGRSADNFDADEVAEEVWGDLVKYNRFNLTIGRKNKTSRFQPSVSVSKSSILPTIAPTADAKLEDENDDEDQDFKFQGKKKKKKKITISNESSDTDGSPDTDIINSRQYVPPIELIDFEMKLADVDDPDAELIRQQANFEYHLRKKPPGLVLVINNMNFPQEIPYRKGSEQDIWKLRQALVNLLGFKFYGDKSHKNVPDLDALKKLLGQFKEELVKDEMESCIVIMLSHGKDDAILLTGSDDKTNVARLTEHILIEFSEDKFEKFAGKPKIFIQATCQTFGRRMKQVSLCNEAHKLYDMIVCCSVLPGYTAKRNPDDGTVFIHYFTKNLVKHAKAANLEEIMNYTVIDIQREIKKAGHTASIPYHRRCAFGKFYFIPKTPELTGRSHESDEEDMNVDD